MNKSNQFTANAVKRARERAGLSQAELSRQLKLSTPQSVSNIERGVSPLPWKQIPTISRYLKVKPVYLVDCVMRDLRSQVSKAAGVAR